MSCNAPKDPTQNDIKGKIIPFERAAALYENYTARRKNLIEEYEEEENPGVEFLPTRYVYFTYSKLKEYMDYLECIDNNLPEGDEIKSIRVYFGNYASIEPFIADPNTSEADRQAAENAVKNKNTIMMLPTRINSRNAEVGFSWNRDTRLPGDINDTGNDSLIFNEAGLCPPPYNFDSDL